jgi:serine protease AprX
MYTRLVALVLVCLFFVPAFNVFGDMPGPTTPVRDLLKDPSSFKDAHRDSFDPTSVQYTKTGVSVPSRATVSLNWVTFDPLTEKPKFPSELMTTGDIYIVQFKGLVYPYMKAGVTASGAEILQYLPENAFAVRMTPSAVSRVSSLSYIRSVSPFYLYFKIAPELVGLQSGLVAVDFSAWNGHPTDSIVAELLTVGGLIESVDPIMVRAWVNKDQILEVASDPMVWHCQPHIEVVFENNKDSDIIDVRHLPDGAYNNPADGLWTYNAGAFQGLATGKGTIVADVDTGLDGTHPNFGDATNFPNKKVWFKSYVSASKWFDNDGHGTHTSGTATGIGKHRSGTFDGFYAGMAPEAGIIEIRMDGNNLYSYMNDPLTHGANISTNSWGSGGGLNQYDDTDAGYDQLVRDSNFNVPGDQYLITFFSAGNSGGAGVSIPGTSKNVITVGASGGDYGDQNTMAGFSSTGPTADNRIKPDISAPGTNIISSWSGGTDFTGASGTSMACPTSAGAGAVIIDYYNRTWHVTPTPALMKALLADGATPLPGYTYPGSVQGWGRINLARTLLETANRKIFHADANASLILETGTFVSYNVTVNSNAELRAHLAWLDEPGQAGANKELVNDLDLKIIDPSGTVYMGNNFQNSYSKSGNTTDRVNNLEGFRLAAPAPGKWQFQVIGANVPSGPQDWALVISGDITVEKPNYFFQDLTVTGMTLANINPIEGVPNAILANIANVGRLPLSLVNYIVLVDDLPVRQDTLAILDVGQSEPITVPWIPVRGMHTINITVDPNKKLHEINKDNNSMVSDFMVQNYGISGKLLPALQEVEPGRNVSFKIDITDTGTIPDTYDFTLGPVPEGFKVNLTKATATVGVGKKVDFELHVTAPEKAVAGNMTTYRIDVVSRGNASYNMVFQPKVKIKKLTGFEFNCSVNTTVTIDPNLSWAFPFKMINLGNDVEPVSISVATTNPSWTSYTNLSNTLLDPFGTEGIKLTVMPPIQVLGEDYVMITVNALTASGLTDEVTFTVRAAKVYNLTVDYVQNDKQISPGGEVKFDLTLTNSGNSDETAQVTALVPKGWEALFDEDIPYVNAYNGLQDYLTIMVPKNALAGDYNITILTQGDHINSTKTFKVKVTQSFGLEVQFNPIRQLVKQKETTKFTMTITNTGNGIDTFDVHLMGAPSEMLTKYASDKVTIGPGKSAKINLTVSAQTTAAGIYQLTAGAVSEGSSALSSDVPLQVQVQAVTTGGGGGGGNNGGGGGGGGGGDDTPKPSFLQLYGKYLLMGLVLLIGIIVVIVLVARRRSSKALNVETLPAQSGTRSLSTFDEFEAPPKAAPAPKAYPRAPEPAPLAAPPKAAPVPAPTVTPAPVAPKPEPRPPVVEPPKPQIAPQAPPAPRPEPSKAAPVVAPRVPPKPAPKDEIDDMISNLLTKN